MKLTLKLLIFVVVLNCTLTVNSYARTINIAYFNAPPLIEKSADVYHPTGPVADMWKLMADDLGLEIRWVYITIKSSLKYLLNDKIDATALFTVTPARSKLYTFPDFEFSQLQPTLVVLRKSDLIKINNANDLSKYKISYTPKAVITPWFQINKIKFSMVEGKNIQERLFKILLKERTDAIFWPCLRCINHTSLKLRESNKVRFVKSPMGPYPFAPMFSKSKNGNDPAKQFSKAYKKISKKYNFDRNAKLYSEALK